MKNETNSFFLGLSLGVAISAILLIFLPPTPKIEQGQKMKECVEEGGELEIRDWSLREDGSDYRATCKIPGHYYFQYKI